jgi:hypothetical protein
MAVSAAASIEVGDSFTITVADKTPWPYSPYTMTKKTTGASESFQTFCAERAEEFYSGHTYKVANIGTVTQNTHYKLTDYVAWLYTSFRNGALSQIDTSAEYNLLQNAIWAGMVKNNGEIGSSDSEFQIAKNDWKAYDNLGIGINNFKAAGWTKGLGDVVVLNMVYGTDNAAQDQLGLVENQSQSATPEPTALAIWSILGLTAVGAHGVRRRARSTVGARQPAA